MCSISISVLVANDAKNQQFDRASRGTHKPTHGSLMLYRGTLRYNAFLRVATQTHGSQPTLGVLRLTKERTARRKHCERGGTSTLCHAPITRSTSIVTMFLAVLLPPSRVMKKSCWVRERRVVKTLMGSGMLPRTLTVETHAAGVVRSMALQYQDLFI